MRNIGYILCKIFLKTFFNFDLKKMRYDIMQKRISGARVEEGCFVKTNV